jgi:hypothetical protein
MHMRVSDVKRWWEHIDGLDLASRYAVKTQAPQMNEAHVRASRGPRAIGAHR